MSTLGDLVVCGGTPSCDAQENRHFIGSLQYLSLTRLDVAYFVSKFSQYMNALKVVHM
uniref:Retrovirus-related Pol polyprotein from transposon TNT 1-94 n=1 Tax=Cajanus cajan TaxID=3821 RepID=A0A151S813_CAJCA|nr:hypothetical protein KK1_027166 [Cajanus cajan]